jgi:hypothetical protein
MASVAPQETTEHDGLTARTDAIVARLDGEPLCIGDARDLIVCIEDEPARVVPHAWARAAMTALGGPAFAAAVESVPRAPGEILVIVAAADVLDVRIIRLRPMQRGGAA